VIVAHLALLLSIQNDAFATYLEQGRTLRIVASSTSLVMNLAVPVE
jgi:hypothetical protein